MRFVSLFAVGTVLWALTGCSGFNREYQQTLAATRPAGDSIEGAWEGRWQSQGGHGGDRLRAILTKNGPDTYIAQFRAKYWGIFEADQETLLRVTGTSPVRASGESDLGYLKGGVYRYEATITPETFDATYKSSGDHGVFTLTRPQARQ